MHMYTHMHICDHTHAHTSMRIDISCVCVFDDLCNFECKRLCACVSVHAEARV